MDEGKIKDLEQLLRVALLVAQSQDRGLITADDRKTFYEDLNGKSHVLIIAVLAS